MVKIRFTAQGSNSMIGGFTTGDIANVGEAIAKHLVEEAQVARYMDAAEPAKSPTRKKTASKKQADAAPEDSASVNAPDPAAAAAE